MGKHRIRTFFHSRKTMGGTLSVTKPELSKLENKDVVYSLPCECGSIYYGETQKPLGVRLGEQKKNVNEGKTNCSKLAEHLWEKKHKVLWDSVGIFAYENNWYKRKIVDAAFMVNDRGCLSQASKEISGI